MFLGLFTLIALSYVFSSISNPSITTILSVTSFIVFLLILNNKGHMLIALLLLESASASLVPMVITYSASVSMSSIIVFLFIVVVVCEACMGLASLLYLVRSPSMETSKSIFFY